MSKLVLVDDIVDGMSLLEPIVNQFGQTLLTSGTMLKETHKRILKTWNIRQVNIKSDDSDEEIEISDELRQQITEKILKRMKWEPRNKIENDLLNMAVTHTARLSQRIRPE